MASSSGVQRECRTSEIHTHASDIIAAMGWVSRMALDKGKVKGSRQVADIRTKDIEGKAILEPLRCMSVEIRTSAAQDALETQSG